MIKFFSDYIFFVGELTKGKRDGKGVLYNLKDYQKGFKVEGFWVNDKLEGPATITTSYSIEKAMFKNDVRHGKCETTFCNGVIEINDYYRGNLIGHDSSVKKSVNEDFSKFRHYQYDKEINALCGENHIKTFYIGDNKPNTENYGLFTQYQDDVLVNFWVVKTFNNKLEVIREKDDTYNIGEENFGQF